jgi:hypothetical protein
MVLSYSQVLVTLMAFGLASAVPTPSPTPFGYCAPGKYVNSGTCTDCAGGQFQPDAGIYNNFLHFAIYVFRELS